MNILLKSSNGISQVSMDSKLLLQRKIWIEGKITSETACEFVKKLLILNSDNSQERIDILICSAGGEINAGMLMYDAVQSSKAPIRMFCMGMCYSMAAVLFASGNYGRYMLPHGELMLHEPLLGNRVEGNSSSIKSISDSLLETKHKMNLILAKHTGKSEEEVEKACSFDHYFSPQECIEFGLADEIVDFRKIMEE